MVLGSLITISMFAWRAYDSSGGGARPIAVMPSKPKKEAPAQPVRNPRPSVIPAPTQVPKSREITSSRSIIGRTWESPEPSELTSFAEWTKRYTIAANHDELMAEGMRLASHRRVVMANLIRTDPMRALAAAVPMMVRKQLPPEVVALLEERVSGTGELALHAATPAPGRTVDEPLFRSALIGDKEYQAYTYGRRNVQASLTETAITGVAIDGALAVSESPLRLLEKGETPDGRPVDEVCVVSGKTSSVTEATPLNVESSTAVEVSGKVHVLCQPEHVALFETSLIQSERTAANNQPGTSGVVGRPPITWSQGTKKVLVIRVDFSDKVGTPVNPFDSQPITEDYAANRFNAANGVRDFYQQGSYGKTTLSVAPTVSTDSPDITSVLRMPNTATSYALGGANSLLHSHARIAAQTAGFAVDSYDRICVAFGDLSGISSSQITYGGLGDIVGKNFWINGHFTFAIVTHEIGHTYGLTHANLLQVADGNPVSPSGTSVEYGDVFDVMGDGEAFENHFSQWNKSILQWIPDTAVTTVTSGGTYRVYRFDHQGANLANALALKIVRNRNEDYWIGHRRATGNASLNNGAYIVLGYNDNQEGNLLDMTTPGVGVNDAALAVGATFNDTVAGITLNPTARGGSGADEWLDVQVTIQPRIQWALGTFLVDEQSGSATLSLTRTGNSAGAVSVNYATAPGTATTPADYTTSSSSVSWANGDMSNKTITIPIMTDAIVEGTQNFTVTLSSPVGGVIVDSPTTTVTIADAGANDPSFVPEFINNSVTKVVVNPDGSMIAVGWFGLIQDAAFINYDRGGITSLSSSGTLIPSFADGGGAGGGVSNTVVYDIARQPDGKYIVAGNFTTMNGVSRNRVARLHTDGTLDTSFNPGTGANGIVYAVLLQPDGKIILGGRFTTFNGIAREYLVRLNADGSVDTSFAGPDFADTSGWWVESFAMQPDGKLLVGGDFYFSDPDFNGVNYRACICRVSTTGARDPDFNGVVQGADHPSYLPPIKRIAVQNDGKILIAGDFTFYNGAARGGLARLTSTGALDIPFAPTSNGACYALLLQPDDKILVGGTFTTFNGSAANRLARVSSTGTLDNAFVAAGGTTGAIGNFALQSDGKVVFCGDFGTFQGQPEAPVSRFFAGLPGLPGLVQFASETYTGIEGTSATISVTRTGGTLGALSVNYSTVPGTATSSDFTAASGTLSWANGDAATKTIVVPITSDALAESAESLKVNLGEALIGSALLGNTQQTTVNVTTSFGSWVTTYFTPLEQSNASISGDLADPDFDGISNLLEFALNLAPKTPGSSGLPTAVVQNVGGTNYLTLTFKRRLPTLDLLYTPKTNATLPGTWNADAVQVGSPVNNGDGTETVTYRDSVPTNQLGTSRRFMRLDVLRTP
ncbi:hypothetical protein BH11VER1_BH11VER1_22360 [soil metagenome]